MDVHAFYSLFKQKLIAAKSNHAWRRIVEHNHSAWEPPTGKTIKINIDVVLLSCNRWGFGNVLKKYTR